MALSQATIRTAQFYAWEQRGRGWQHRDYLVELEPPFIPFYAYRNAAVQKADGSKPDNEPVEYVETDELSIIRILLPKQFQAPRDMVGYLLEVFAQYHSMMSFEIVANEEEVSLYLVCREQLERLVLAQLKTYFPALSFESLDTDPVLDVLNQEQQFYTVDFGLNEEFIRPLATLNNSSFEPLTSLFATLNHLAADEAAVVQILFCGAVNDWADTMLDSVTDGTKQSFFIDAPEMPTLASQKGAQKLFGVAIRIVTAADTAADAHNCLQQLALGIVNASTSPFNSLIPLQDASYTISERLTDVVFRQSHRVGMLLSTAELTTFVHIPATSHFQKLVQTMLTTKAVPAQLAGHSYTLGINEHLGRRIAASISAEQRLRHIHIIGATGTGKSTLLRSLIMQDITHGNGLCILDPHGDLIDDLLQHIPEERIEDVVLIDPSDSAFPIGLNILRAHSDVERELLASDLVALFRRFSTSWGDQMNSVFANAILAFVYNTKQYHLGDLRRFLIEPVYRTYILATVTDSEIVYYWQKEFLLLKGSSIASILTRLDSFLRPKVIRQMVCQTKSIDMADCMDSGKIILVKLSQGLLGAENSYLLGAFIVSKLQQTAMSRQAQQARTRIPFYTYIDEFHHFITPSMAAILSGARKYGLGLILAHQDMNQVQKYDTELANSLLSNAGTRICFRLGDTDAKRLADGFSAFNHIDLQNLQTGQAIARVNTADADFNVEVMPFRTEEQESYVDEIIEYSRAHYSVPIESSKTISLPPAPPIQPKLVQPKKAPTPEELPPTPIQIKEVPDAPQQLVLREHRYVQTFIKTMAEAQGYKAQLEVPTPDGTGQVDVLLEKDGQQIAVEISVTTTAKWELHNIEKCLAAGYTCIVVCVTNPTKLNTIKALIASSLTETECTKVQVISNNEIGSLFVGKVQPQTTPTLIKGYRVKVKYEPNATRQDLLESIVKATRKP